jgi:hypothetical protein
MIESFPMLGTEIKVFGIGREIEGVLLQTKK